jgi:hypothetical protein
MTQVAGELDVPIMIGVGAAFDYIAGSKLHAPRSSGTLASVGCSGWRSDHDVCGVGIGS